MCELRLFLDLLDREYLSAGVREKKMHLSNILHRVLSDKGELNITFGTFRTFTCREGEVVWIGSYCYGRYY